MANQLGKFTSKIVESSQPMLEFLNTKVTWLWGLLKMKCSRSSSQHLPILQSSLCVYNPEAKLKVSAHTSAYGIGAVLLQQSPNSPVWKPVAYASRAMSDTEQRYSQIEKEALGVVWACEKFPDYMLGK